jgi:cell division protein FtsZ
MPFSVEGQSRTQNAEWGLNLLTRFADTVLLVPNDKLLEVAPKLPLDKAFKVADEVLMRSIKGITEIITKPGMVNLDFNDLKTIMSSGGLAMVGIGMSDDPDDRAKDAVMAALSSPLLDVDVAGATGALVSVVGGSDMSVSDAEKVVQITSDRINPGARIIWGASIDQTLERELRVMLVITGVKSRLLEEHLDHAPPSGGEQVPRYKQVQQRAEGGYGASDDDLGLDFVR